jgi:ATP-dependent RNA helicase SUPV3L1/SUV3
MARGIAYRLVEALGVLPRAEIADDVKGLDQESRAGLRKHGVRFGQYTVFMPLLLKPAPTRLRLVLWALKEGMEVFPEAPPPGLVTMAVVPDAPAGYYPRAGYRRAGDRAVRIDMLERLADMIRPLDARAGFEATADMLSITGLTLEQFARLMQGLGFEAREGTRPKRKPAAAVPPAVEAQEEPAAPETAAPGSPDPETPAPDVPVPEVPIPAAPDAPIPDTPPADAPDAPIPGAPEEVAGIPPVEAPPPAPDEVPEPPQDAPHPGPPPEVPPASPGFDPTTADSAPSAEPDAATEIETFYVFTRAPRRRPERVQKDNRRPQPARARQDAGPEEKPKGKPGSRRGDRPRRGAKPDMPERENRAETPRPPRQEKPIDPDNPFAALLALKLKK